MENSKLKYLFNDYISKYAMSLMGENEDNNRKIASMALRSIDAVNKSKDMSFIKVANPILAASIPAILGIGGAIATLGGALSSAASPIAGRSAGKTLYSLESELAEDDPKVELLKAKIRNKYELARDIEERIRDLGVEPKLLLEYAKSVEAQNK